MAFREEDFKVATIEIWPNSVGQGGYISVYASAMRENAQDAVWLRGDFDGPGALSSKVADRFGRGYKARGSHCARRDRARRDDRCKVPCRSAEIRYRSDGLALIDER